VNLLITPPGQTVDFLRVFSVDIAVEAGEQPVDVIDAYLSFDPTRLRVVDATGNASATITPEAPCR